MPNKILEYRRAGCVRCKNIFRAFPAGETLEKNKENSEKKRP
ncbi:hypothetical protein [Treponema sp. R8-4-B8]